MISQKGFKDCLTWKEFFFQVDIFVGIICQGSKMAWITASLDYFIEQNFQIISFTCPFLEGPLNNWKQNF